MAQPGGGADGCLPGVGGQLSSAAVLSHAPCWIRVDTQGPPHAQPGLWGCRASRGIKRPVIGWCLSLGGNNCADEGRERWKEAGIRMTEFCKPIHRLAGKLDPQTPLGTAKAEQKISNSPLKLVEATDMMKAAMYSVEITVEKDRVTGETKVLSSTTLLPKNHCLQGVKVYEDEMKVVHAVHMEDGAIENGVHPLSSSEVDELIHKADEANLGEVSQRDSKTKEREEAKKGGPESNLPSQKTTPRKEITGVQAKPVDSPRILASGEGAEPSKEQPVTMIFMGYQNVEDENETKKVLGLGGTIKAELVVIDDADTKPAAAGAADCTGKDHAPPNGSTVEPVAALPQKEDSQVGEKPGANDTDPKGADQDLDMKKHRCKCCTVM
ncbi:paralemmin-1 isoform X2 [Chelonia mydas]|uniref:paralemmin-1 isoform X2 n=1 Tax=Chelonia mydas TaxID=8469 RepID=UPI001CA8AFCA|nr:paralemmin-1 isoform X2 [Chelonia mydas]